MTQIFATDKDDLFLALDEALNAICDKAKNCSLEQWRNFWYPLSGISEPSLLLDRITRIGEELFYIGGVEAMVEAAEFVGGGLERCMILDYRWGNIGKDSGRGYWPPSPRQR